MSKNNKRKPIEKSLDKPTTLGKKVGNSLEKPSLELKPKKPRVTPKKE